jgi:hypothetical protein
MKFIFLAGLMAMSMPARASLTFTGLFEYGGVIPQSANAAFPLTDHETVNRLADTITSFTLVVTFSSSSALDANGSGVQGELLLGTGGSAPYVNFTPVVTTTVSVGNGVNYVYDMTFSDLPGNPGNGFNGLNPNGTWSLELWDNNVNYGNELVGWSLDITAVPEPVNVAIGVFGAVFTIGAAVRYFCQGKFRFTEPLNTLEPTVKTPVEKCDKE